MALKLGAADILLVLLVGALAIAAFAAPSPAGPHAAAPAAARFGDWLDRTAVDSLGERAAAVANALLVGVALLAARRALAGRLGRWTSICLAVWTFATPTFAFVWRHDGTILVFACAVVAGALLVHKEGHRTAELSTMYEGELPSARGSFARPLATGALLGIVTAHDWTYAPLLVAAIVALPIERRRASAWALLGAAALPIAVAIGHFGLELPPPPALSPSLLGWGLVDFAIGRHVGVVWAFVALWLSLAFTGSLGEGRGALALSVAGAVALKLLASPFDLAGPSRFLGPAWFVPLAGALWLSATRPARIELPLVAAALAAPWMLPLWFDPKGGAVLPSGIERPLAALRARLPVETTLLARWPETLLAERDGVELRAVDGELRCRPDGTLQIFGERRAELVFVSAQPLHSIRLVFEERAPTGLEVDGARLATITFRPTGEVAYNVDLESPFSRHPIAAGGDARSFYRFRVHFTKAPPAPIAFRFEAVTALAPGGAG